MSAKLSDQTVANLQEAFKLALSMALMFTLALWLNWDLPKYGALAVALISLDTRGASLQKGLMRIIGTTFGLIFGLVVLSLFAQNSLATLLTLTVYLMIVGYCLQSSRYPYAWFVAGFLPPLVWASTYGKIDNAFSYATFRYLETVTGVVIYTAVSGLIWPRHAGDKLNRQVSDSCRQLHRLLVQYREQLDRSPDENRSPTSPANLADTVAGMKSTLEAAYADTPAVAHQSDLWKSFGTSMRTAVDSLEMWRQSIDGCQHLDLHRWLPNLDACLANLENRTALIDDLWSRQCTGSVSCDSDELDGAILESHTLVLAADSNNDLSHLDRAALLSLVQQLRLFDRSSRDMLLSTRMLLGLTPVKSMGPSERGQDSFDVAPFDFQQFKIGSIPACCFVVAWFFWIFFNPPTGPSVPSQAATFGLLLVMAPINMLKMIPLVLASILGIVAPVYFWLMPRLSTGVELFAFVFGLTFTISVFLVGRLAPLRTLILASFVMLTNISNTQSYSFNAIIDGLIMMMLGIIVTAVVQAIVMPGKPEDVLTKSVQDFFLGCSRVVDGYVGGTPEEYQRRCAERKRWFESTVLPSRKAAQSASSNLNYSQYSQETSLRVNQLIDAMLRIENRLRTMELSHRKVNASLSGSKTTVTGLADAVRKTLKNMMDRCANLEADDEHQQRNKQLQIIAQDLQKRFDELESQQDDQRIDDALLESLYATMGAARGLIESTTVADGAIGQINWRQLATPRF